MAQQRSYTAPCPGCGAPVEFRSAQSTHAVCPYCRSTVVREGDTLARIGRMAELFDDHSPLRLLARGTWRQRAFTVVGRLQFRSGSGPWTEWHCLFEDGTAAWLAEDNGAYVMAQAASTQREVPRPEHFRVGATTSVSGRSYTVASIEQAALVSAQGELPRLPPLDTPFTLVELRSADNEVLSIDYGAQPPGLARGRPVALEELRLSGLREENVKTSRGRQFACPHCGAPVEVQLADSKSITCRACNSLIDLTSGVGGELRHAEQHEPVEPLIPLGSIGKLQGVEWQVVGYQHRLGTEPEDPDEHFGWDEYLLYNRQRGFCFLVDATDGWSLVKPATGAPTLSSDLRVAKYLGTTYRQQYAYKAQTNFVKGEFYWPVARGQVSFNRDYAAAGQKMLAMEETATERTWSIGAKIAGTQVARAFRLEKKLAAFGRADVGPTTAVGAGGGSGSVTAVAFMILLFLMVAILASCEDDDEYGGSGGSGGSSYRGGSGGWSGGAHK